MRHLKKYKIFESLVGEDLEFKLLCRILDSHIKEYSNAPLLKPIIPTIIIGGKSYKTTVLLRDRESDVFSCIDRWAENPIIDADGYNELKDGLFEWFNKTFGINAILFIDKLQEMSDEYEISISDLLSEDYYHITLYIDGRINFNLSIPHRHDSLSSIESFFNDFSKTMSKEWTPHSISYANNTQTLETEIRLS